MITGLIDFNKKTCVFKLDKDNFLLEIEEIEERDNQSELNWDFIFERKPMETNIEQDLLVGRDFENGQLIHFHILNFSQTGAKTYQYRLSSYIILNGNETVYNSMQIQAEELNWFHNVSQAYEREAWSGDTGMQIKINPHSETTKDFNFNFKNETISGKLNIYSSLSSPSTTPIKIKSNLNYYFNATSQVSDALELVFLTFELFQFLSYRKNIHINGISLKKLDNENTIPKNIGQLFVNTFSPKETEDERVIRERIIDYPLIQDSFSNLLEKLSNKNIYLKHIPEKYKGKKIITPARFVMATAGFEWQIRFSHREESERSEEKYKEQKDEILEFLDDRIEKTSGKAKKYFKSFKKIASKTDSSLSEKLLWAMKELDDVLNIFIERTYKHNNVESDDFTYQAISERIQTHRNNIAHGNIDQEYDKLVILDFMVLEWLYYAMVLDDIEVPRENIQASINKLFKLNIGL